MEEVTYIGVKVIHAIPQNAPEDIGNYKKGDLGYRVEYADGFVSWSPKGVFESAYRDINGSMTFGLAIEAMRIGFKVSLPKWSKDVFISIQHPDDKSKMTAPYFYVTSRFGMVPWIPTMIEMFSEEWMQHRD